MNRVVTEKSRKMMLQVLWNFSPFFATINPSINSPTAACVNIKLPNHPDQKGFLSGPVVKKH